MKRDTRSSRISIIIAVALLAAMAIGVALLVMFKKQLHTTTQRLPEQISAGLRPAMLRMNDEIPRFDQLERFGRWAKRGFPVEQLYITKLRADNLERCVYPWYHRGLPNRNKLQSIKIEQDGVVLGYLYLALDTRNERLLENLTSLLIPLLILAAVALAFHVWRQERMLLATRVELAGKNRELSHLERLSLAGQLAANLLHDLKKPVLHIKDALQHKEEPLERDLLAEHADMFLHMLKETSLEKLTAASNERQEYLDIEEVLQTALNLVKYEKDNIEVTLSVQPDLPFVQGYKYQLVQVFSNVLLNAYQAMEGKGSICIDAILDESARRINLSFSDDGPGIAAEDLPHVMEPFYSASGRVDSSGLGLYISSTIIDETGGRIKVNSTTGKGTTVLISLPCEIS